MRTVISAGALALTLGGVFPMVVAIPVRAATRMDDCENRGLLGGVTGGLCGAVGTVGDIVNGLAGSTSAPESGGGTLDARVDTPADDAGGILPATPLTPDVTTFTTPTPEEAQDDGPLPKGFDDVCPVLTGSPECADSTAISTPDETVRPSTSPRPSPSRSGRPRSTGNGETSPPPRQSRRPPETRTHATDEGEPVVTDPPPVIDAEAPRLELLWPAGPVMQRFQRAVTPTRSPDPLGTALTTALLVAAILAVRLLYAKRAGEESIPFEPLRARRHRTA